MWMRSRDWQLLHWFVTWFVSLFALKLSLSLSKVPGQCHQANFRKPKLKGLNLQTLLAEAHLVFWGVVCSRNGHLLWLCHIGDNTWIVSLPALKISEFTRTLGYLKVKIFGTRWPLRIGWSLETKIWIITLRFDLIHLSLISTISTFGAKTNSTLLQWRPLLKFLAFALWFWLMRIGGLTDTSIIISTRESGTRIDLLPSTSYL